jgi:regulator of sigma E protease
MNMILISIAAFIVAIGILVAVHEWGHYIVARMLGVKVLKFSIGFGKPLWSRTAGPDNTEYCISAIPLGGFVKLLDEREEQVEHFERNRAFNHQPIASRLAILAAGPVMNFLFAILAYWMMFVAGVPGLQPIVGDVEPASIADKAGFSAEDRIVSMGGEPVATWEGAIIALLDAMLTDPRVSVEVVTAEGEKRLLYLDIQDKVAELTEPGRLLSGMGLSFWAPDLPPVIGVLRSDGAAHAAGFEVGDRVTSANGDRIDDWTAWVDFIRPRPGELVNVNIERNGQNLMLAMTVGQRVEVDGLVIGFIGSAAQMPDDLYAAYEAEQRYGFFRALPVAIERTLSMSLLTVRMLARMVTGDVSVKNISGPINIAQYAGYSASVGLVSFIGFMAIVSLSLGILNLLPIPILDGGQIVYQLLEAIKGSPLSERAQLVGQQIGFVFLMLAMSFAFYNDLNRFFS